MPDDLRPVTETDEAFVMLSALGDEAVAESMLALGRRVREVAPDCVALSLTLDDSGFTFTLASEQRTSRLMDAVQYLDSGPCVEAVAQAVAQHLEIDDAGAPVDEDRWWLMATAGRRLGILSTLSLPVLDDGRVVAGVNLYGRTRDAFTGRVEELAAVCGAWSGGAVTNADLDFTSRVRAAATPDRILERRDLDTAAGVVARLLGLAPEDALARILRAAVRAQVSGPELARFLLDAHGADVAADD